MSLISGLPRFHCLSSDVWIKLLLGYQTATNFSSDVNYLSTSAPPAAAEWSSLLRPLRGREPEGMWNLLSIVREMFKRSDRNAIPLLEIITEEVMACEQVCVFFCFNYFIIVLKNDFLLGSRYVVFNHRHLSL